MAMDYQTTIRAEIAHHHEEIRKLTAALEVIERLWAQRQDTKQAKQAEKVEKVEKPAGPLFTVRKVKPIEAPKKSMRGSNTVRNGSYAEWRERVLDKLRKDGPMASGEMAKAFGVRGDKHGRQAVYNALSHLKVAGTLSRDHEGGKYFFPETEAPVVEPVSEDQAATAEAA